MDLDYRKKCYIEYIIFQVVDNVDIAYNIMYTYKKLNKYR